MEQPCRCTILSLGTAPPLSAMRRRIQAMLISGSAVAAAYSYVRSPWACWLKCTLSSEDITVSNPCAAARRSCACRSHWARRTPAAEEAGDPSTGVAAIEHHCSLHDGGRGHGMEYLHRAVGTGLDRLAILCLHDLAQVLQRSLMRGAAGLGGQLRKPGFGVLHRPFAQDSARLHQGCLSGHGRRVFVRRRRQQRWPSRPRGATAIPMPHRKVAALGSNKGDLRQR